VPAGLHGATDGRRRANRLERLGDRVRRVLDERWGRPRFEVVSERLGLRTPFVLRPQVSPGTTPDVVRHLDRLSQTRVSAHFASDFSVLCVGLVADRPALATFVDNEIAAVREILAVTVDVVLTEPRRCWFDRDQASGLGEFRAPALL
jgi:hypothetical protein